MSAIVKTLIAGTLLVGLAMDPAAVFAADEKAPPVSLGEAGKQLEKKYSELLSSLKTEIAADTGVVKDAGRAAFMAACEAEMTAARNEAKARQALNAKNPTDKAQLEKNLAEAVAALTAARAAAITAATPLLPQVEPLLASGRMDAQLVKAAVLVSATPAGLAEFAQQGPANAALIDRLLSDNTLMMQMLVAGGARHGRYGNAMRIYSDILAVAKKDPDGVFQRLALATALEHARPIPANNAVAEGKDEDDDAPTSAPAEGAAFIDPVKRYHHYEKAYLDGELDQYFKHLTAWEYRMVVGCDAPDDVLAWGRSMLKNYRPDLIQTNSDGWRYSSLVKTDVLYGSQDVKNDLPTLNPYQNMIKNGGVCGRRAFFGRFLLRSFGIPVWGVTQHKHAALSRWTPKGWVVNLGAGFQWSWWDKDEHPRSGVDFLLETQARRLPDEYMRVLRAKWLSQTLGEKAYNDRTYAAGGFWSAIAHHSARAIATSTKAVELAPVGQDVAESNDSKEEVAVAPVTITESDKKVSLAADGTITIPAVALDKGKGKFVPMKNTADGARLHIPRELKAEQQINYTVEAPKAGTYTLTARVVTVQSDQKLLVKTNGAQAAVEMPLPYTIGGWEQTAPVQITLTQGRNVITFSRPAPNRGITVKEFILTPVK